MSEERPSDLIPTPWSGRWREFRISVLPVGMFLGAVTVAALLWKHAAVSTGIAGVGEGVRSVVSSPQSAGLQRILVRPYQIVNAGDPVAIVLPVDARVDLGLLQAELAIARLQLQPSIAEDNAMNFEQIRIELLRTKSELAIARVNFDRLENQVRRNTPLFAEQLVSEDIHDLAVKTRDMFQVEVFEKSNAVTQIEKRVQELESLGLPPIGTTNAAMSAMLARLNALHAAVATNWGPITLVAPISGMVSSISRQEGENIVEGEPLIGINSLVSERLIGYLRQPYPMEPEVGLEVVMTTRERKSRQVVGVITEVGAQVEMITNALAFVRTGALVDAGLPVVVSLPAGLSIRPGEILDMNFRKPRPGPGQASSGLIQRTSARFDTREQSEVLK